MAGEKQRRPRWVCWGAQGCVCAQGNTRTSVLCGFCDGTTGLRVSRGKGTSGTGGTFRGSSELCPSTIPALGPRGDPGTLSSRAQSEEEAL